MPEPTPAPTPDPRASAAPLRVLVTGGAGFIGSHLVDALIAQGATVTVIDNLSTGRRSNLAQHLDASGHDESGRPRKDRLRFIEADLGRALDALGDGEIFDEIYHLAAAVGVRLVVSDPINSIHTNVAQTEALLRFADARSKAGHPTKVLIASSSEVYGKGSKVPFHEEDDVVYGSTSVVRWSYACSKAIDEHLALAYHSSRHLPVVITRFFNTVGPRQVGDYGMVLPRFVDAALANRTLEVHGDGSQSRCFCDVRDVAAILPTLMRTPGCIGRVFNVGSDQSISIADLAQLVIRTVDSKSQIRNIPYVDAFGPGFEDLMVRRPDLSRIKQAVRFAPTITLQRTIQDLAKERSLRPR